MNGNQSDAGADPPIRQETSPPPTLPETAAAVMRPDDGAPPSTESGKGPDATGGTESTDDTGIHLPTDGTEATDVRDGAGDAESTHAAGAHPSRESAGAPVDGGDTPRPEAPETGQAPSEPLDEALEESLDVTVLKLDAIQAKLDRLQRDFESKIKYDAHKAQIIDHLHQELQEYKSDLIRRQLQPTIVDVIKVIDDIRKLTQHYRSLDRTDQDPEKLLHLLENIPSDLEDLLFYQGVEAYVCDGTTFDPARQRILQKIDTTDAAMDKTIATRLRPGYLWNGTILRPELVTVYVHRPPAPTDT